jgi:hypothetical protein
MRRGASRATIASSIGYIERTVKSYGVSTRGIGLIAAEPGGLAQSLGALLLATPLVSETLLVADQVGALAALAHCRPIVAVLALEENAALLAAIKAARPATLCVVLAGDPAGEQAARAAGADLALVTGYPAPKLYRAILDLLEGRQRAGSGQS